MAVDGRPLPADPSERVAILSGAEGVPVTLTFAHRNKPSHDARIVRSARYEQDAFRGSWISVGGRHVATFLIDSLGRLFGLAAATILFLRRPRDPVAALFCFAMILNGFPLATKATM